MKSCIQFICVSLQVRTPIKLLNLDYPDSLGLEQIVRIKENMNINKTIMRRGEAVCASYIQNA